MSRLRSKKLENTGSARSIDVTLTKFSCQGRSCSIKPVNGNALIDGECKVHFCLLSYDHHDIDLSCQAEAVFTVPASGGYSESLDRLSEETKFRWVDFETLILNAYGVLRMDE